MKRPRTDMVGGNESHLIKMAQDVPLSEEEQEAVVLDATFSPRNQLLPSQNNLRFRTKRHHTYPSAASLSSMMLILFAALISCSTARDIVETETIVLSGTRRLASPMSISTPSSLRRRAAVSHDDAHKVRLDDLEATTEVNEQIEHKIEDIEKDLTNTKTNTDLLVSEPQKVHKRRKSRRFCRPEQQLRKCRRCQANVRRKFDIGQCSTDLQAAREGRSCSTLFDKCRNAKFRFRCKRWKDSYDNCFLPLEVSLSDPTFTDPKCEKACDLKFKSDIRMDPDQEDMLNVGIVVWNDCLGQTTLEKLNYVICHKCISAEDGAIVEDYCAESSDLLDEFWYSNKGSSVLNSQGQRYLEFFADPYVNTPKEELAGTSCNYAVTVDYQATATLQVFYEEFEAELDIDWDDDDGEDDARAENGGNRRLAAVQQTVQFSEALDEAFVSYFSKEEQCVYADDDGCGARDVVFAGVQEITEGICEYDDIDPTRRDLQSGDIVAVEVVLPGNKRKGKRKKHVKLKGRNRKNGRCRGKCASRNKKVSDALSSPNRFLAEQEQQQQEEQDQRVTCVVDTAPKPNLKRELLLRQAQVGFATQDAAVVQVKEDKCGINAASCKDGTHGCCGTEGCSCGDAQLTKENCKAGTKLEDGQIEACFLSFSGSITDVNQCCVDPSTIDDECRSTCGL